MRSLFPGRSFLAWYLPVLFVLFMLWGALLRFWNLGSSELWMDEAFSLAPVYALLEHGNLVLENGRTDTTSRTLSYLIAGLSSLTSLSPVGVGKLLSAFLGTLCLGIFYFFVRNLFGSRPVALLAMGLMTFLTFEIAWSQQIRMYVLLQTLILGGLVCMQCWMTTRKFLWLGGLALCTVAALTTHLAGFLLPGIAFGLWLFQLDVRTLYSLITSKEARKNILPFHTTGFSRLIAPWRRSIIAGCLFWFAGMWIVFGRLDWGFSDVLGFLLFGQGRSYLGPYSLFWSEQVGTALLLLMLGGMVAAGISFPRRVLPVLGFTCLYIFVLSFQNELFHLRYLLPVLPFLVAFLAWGMWALARFSSHNKRWVQGMVLGCMVCTLPFHYQFTLLPQNHYVLGYTAPQAPWRESLDWVIHHPAFGAEVNTFMALPIFHDIYLGKDNGHKYFLPFSWSGRSIDIQMTAPYTSAQTVETLEEITRLGGFIILDDFSWKMLINQELRKWLTYQLPDYTLWFEGGDALRIWYIKPNTKLTFPEEIIE